MSFRKFSIRGLLLLFAGCAYTSIVLAQDEPQPQQEEPPVSEGEPKPAARSPFPVIDPNSQDQPQNNEDLTADFTPLTGVQNPSVGTARFRHSFWVPGLQFGSLIQSSPVNGSGSNGWFAQNYFIGNLTLHKAWSRSELDVDYSGGGFVTTGNSAAGTSSSSAYQQMHLAQYFHLNRWLFQVLDEFSYFPQSGFGFGAGTNLGLPGVGGSFGGTVPGIAGNATPNQSIFATSGPVYNNVGIVQATYYISHRSSVTMVGDYGILRFSEPGNIASDWVLGSIGYNYVISRKDTIGIQYMFNSSHYQGEPQAFGNHSVLLAYSRKITGRLALQLNGGPQISTYRIPIGTATQRVGFYATANLNYATHNGSIAAFYNKGFASGSGVLVGSNLDQITFTANRKLTRVWSANVNIGYSRNSPIGGSAQTSFATYNSWYAGAGLNRPFGRFTYFGIAYAAYITKQGSSPNNPNTTSTTNSVNLSLQWHTRPFVLE